jgi:hypothetical protein
MFGLRVPSTRKKERNPMSWSRAVLGAFVIAVACVASSVLVRNASSQPPEEPAKPEPAPPAGQTYTGVKQCSACHFKEYLAWKKTKHAKEAWESVPAKYQADPNCINCHATGYGQPTGFKDEPSTPNLKGTTCEACHGPGSEHEKLCKPFLNVKKLSPEQEKVAKDSIYKILPGNVCQRCHITQGHKEHPKYEKG